MDQSSGISPKSNLKKSHVETSTNYELKFERESIASANKEANLDNLAISNEEESIDQFISKVINVGHRRKTLLQGWFQGLKPTFATNTQEIFPPDDSPTQSSKKNMTLPLKRKVSAFNFSDISIDETKTKSNFEDKKYTEFYTSLIQNNKLWKESCTNQNPDYFTLLSQPQKPKCLVISCSDSRVVVNDCLGLKPGELFSHRNVGNLVISTDFNVQSVIQYAVQVLKVEHLIVIGHTDCGAVKASLTSKHHGLIDHWLRNIREVAEKYSDELEKYKEEMIESARGSDPKGINAHPQHNLVRKMIELNVKEQVLSLCKTPIVQKAWKKGQTLFVHGYVLEIETGDLIDLDIKQEEWDEIEETYKFEFDD